MSTDSKWGNPSSPQEIVSVRSRDHQSRNFLAHLLMNVVLLDLHSQQPSSGEMLLIVMDRVMDSSACISKVSYFPETQQKISKLV